MASNDRNEASLSAGPPSIQERAGSLELKSLRYFVAVAEAGGFRKASQLHGTLQSVLSRKVRELEDQLGVSLFERHREGVRLTNAGRQFLTDSRLIFGQLERATSALGAAGTAGEGALSIGIGCSMSSGFLHRLIKTWRNQHPHVHVVIRDGTPSELVASVVQREVDVTFITGSAIPPVCDMEQLSIDHIFLRPTRKPDQRSRKYRNGRSLV